MHNIKLIMTDLDGTLLAPGEQLTERTRTALKAAQEAGIRVVPISGRHINEIPGCVCGFPGIEYAAGSNGSLIVHLASGNIVHSDTIPADVTAELMALFAKEPCVILAGVGKTSYVDADSMGKVSAEAADSMKQFVEGYGGSIVVLDEILHGDMVAKFSLVYSTPEERVLGWKRFRDRADILVASSGQHMLDFNIAGSGKGRALLRMAALLDIQPSQVMALGDNFNDHGMLVEAGIGVAMGNADNVLKDTADLVTGTNAEDGVAMAIEALLEGRLCRVENGRRVMTCKQL